MEFDQYGFPKPTDFAERRNRPVVTGPRVAMLLGAVAIAALVAVATAYAPDLRKLFNAPRQAAARDRVASLEWQARAATLRKDYPRALAAWNKLAQLLPHDHEPHIGRAEAHLRMGQPAAAAAACSDGLKIAPDNALLLNNRAYFRALARIDLDAALADIDAALAIQRSASYLDTRGYLRYLTGDFPGAAADYDAALKLLEAGEHGEAEAEGHGEIVFHRGLLRKAMGDAKGKLEDYAEARRRGYQWQEEPAPVRQPAKRPAPNPPRPAAEPQKA